MNHDSAISHLLYYNLVFKSFIKVFVFVCFKEVVKKEKRSQAISVLAK